jgi:hypothetical protein
MLLNTADLVASVIQNMKDAEVYRSPQRALINSYFNGNPPWTEQEARDNHILFNFNDKQGCNLLHQARNQLETAFSRRENYYQITLPSCDADERDDWESELTLRINKPLHNSSEWYFTQDECWAGVVLHGTGAKMWPDDQAPIPFFAGIQDLLIPTDSHLSMDNLQCFAFRRKLRPGALFRLTLARGNNMDPGWDRKAVARLLDEYKDLNSNPNSYNFTDHPEQAAELWKQQSGGFYDSDICPEIWMWDFYHREEGQNGDEVGWYRKIILDRDCTTGRTSLGTEPLAFIYSKEAPYARDLAQIIHFQFGDGNNVPPFMYHSVRSLAYLTYELVWTLNRLNCQFTQQMFEQLMTWIKIGDPADRAKMSRLLITPPVAAIPDGLTIVPAQERYQPNYQLLELGMASYKQQIGEMSSTYTQQLDPGTQKERTKFEVQAVLAQTSKLMQSLLSRAYRQEIACYREIARRMALPGTSNFMAKKFQNDCLMAGVPKKWLDFSQWHIEADQVLGSGNRAMEIAEATELYNNRDKFDPQAQRLIDHWWTLAITNDPNKARLIAGLNQLPKVTASVHDANLAFGTLMDGVDMDPPEGLSHVEQVRTLLAMMAQVIQRITQTGNVGTMQELIGLQAVAKYIAKHLAIMAQDKKNKAAVKKFADDLTQLTNLIKAFGQRLTQQQAAQNGAQSDPETMAKIQALMMQEQLKAQGKQAQHAQRLQHNQQKFTQKEQLALAQTVGEEQRKTAQTMADIKRKNLEAIATANRPKRTS